MLVLPAPEAGPRGNCLYAMASKRALGGGLGRVPSFTAGSYVAFVLMVGAGGVVATSVRPLPGLTRSPAQGFPAA